MKRSQKIRVLLGCTAALAVGVGVGLSARAAMNVPAGLAYSGLLKNNGVVEQGTHTHALIFELTDGTGTLCSDVRTGSSIVDGRFDFGNLFASNCTLDVYLAAKPTLFIKVTVDGQTLAPPQPVGTVPFAARARVAETVENVPPAVTAGLVKGWVSFNGSAGACQPNCPINGSFNVTSVTAITGGRAGAYRVTWATPFASSSYVVVGACQRTDTVASIFFQLGPDATTNPLTTTTASIGCGNYNGAGIESGFINVVAYGP